MKPKQNEQHNYPEYSGLNFPSLEKDILAFWEQNDIFKKSISTRDKNKPFVFYEGPPSANGLPGIHHMMSRTLKDIFCRFKTLDGYRVDRKAGWDTHGLPIELSVEKELGITKKDIGIKISEEEYNALCKKNVLKYTDIWNDLTHKMGYWVDLENPYITYENKYIETIWALLQMLYKKDLLYKGYTIQPYSPAAGTGLSSHELNQPGCYRDVKDSSAIAQFKVIKNEKSAFLFDGDNDDVHFLAWTTTPWTLPSNTALAVGEKIEYVKMKTYNQFTLLPVTVILAKDLVGKHFSGSTQSVERNEYHASGPIIPDLEVDVDELEEVFGFKTKAYKSLEVLLEHEPEKRKTLKDYPYWIYKQDDVFKGSRLLGIEYEQLLPYVQPTDGDAFSVIAGDFVTTTDGTGIVHIAPSFGADDMRVAKQNGIGSLTLVDKQGKFLEEVADPQFGLGGEFIKEAYLNEGEIAIELAKQKELLKPIIPQLEKYLSVDDRIILKLKLDNKLFKTERYEHSYPHCWRTDKPVIYYPLDSWFVRVTAIKDKLIAHNKTINWKPKHTGEGRFGQWLENLVDWNLSRSRYWGTPLPIWRTEDKTAEKCVGSLAELQTEIDKAIAAGAMAADAKYKNEKGEIELHKPYVDAIVLISDSGQKMYREADLIDVWFDSGAMPYAQWNWLPENQAADPFGTIPKFPADYIAEGVDQTRGWFYTLHVLGVALFDSVAYKNVISNGLLLDKNGNKMSKRLGNVVDPFEAINKYGADPTRWYMTRNSDPWDNLKFDTEGIVDVTRSLYGTLYNTYSFFALYANIDRFVIDKNSLSPISERTELDRWILSKLNSLVKDVTAFYNDYEPTKAARAIEEFVDVNLSNWHIRLSRRRFWKGEMSSDKQAAYETLFVCLETVAQLMSPVSPFFSEWLWQSLHSSSGLEKRNSIHLSNLPKTNETVIDTALEHRMLMAQRVSSMVLSLRKKEMIKVRQPLQKILIPIANKAMQVEIEKVESYILNEVNVKEILYVEDTSDMVKKKIKPNFKSLGKRAGPKIKAVQEAVAKMAQSDIAIIEREQTFALDLSGEKFDISIADVEISSEDIAGWLVATDNGLTVALDVALTPSLLLEGTAREFVNKVQNLRKDKGFEVLDRIKVIVERNQELASSLATFNDYIANEILANEIRLVDSLIAFDEIEFNETTLKVQVEKI
jgi:isoleucyl-tRNA synthetase